MWITLLIKGENLHYDGLGMKLELKFRFCFYEFSIAIQGQRFVVCGTNRQTDWEGNYTLLYGPGYFGVDQNIENRDLWFTQNNFELNCFTCNSLGNQARCGHNNIRRCIAE